MVESSVNSRGGVGSEPILLIVLQDMLPGGWHPAASPSCQSTLCISLTHIQTMPPTTTIEKSTNNHLGWGIDRFRRHLGLERSELDLHELPLQRGVGHDNPNESGGHVPTAAA
jgi:hypothetical protein